MNYLINPLELDSYLNVLSYSKTHYDHRYKFCFDLLYRSGVRALEAINMDMWYRISNDVFELVPQKGNDKRIFVLQELPESFSDVHSVGNEYFNGLTYRQLEYSVGILFGKNAFYVKSKSLKCHLFRHNYAKRMFSNGYSVTDIAHKMGERNLESASGYIHSEIKSFYKIN